MRHLLTVGLMALLMPLASLATEFKEGVHYEVVAEQGTKKPEIMEFFSFYCPHCNNFEPVIADMKPMLGEGIQFKKTHVDFVGVRDQDNQKMMTQALATAEVLPQKDKLIAAIFKHYHGKRAKFNSLADVKDVFAAEGVDAATFDKFYNSFSVRTMASKMKRTQDNWQKKGVLNSVPTFIVNGKYKLILGKESGISDAKGISELVNYLAEK